MAIDCTASGLMQAAACYQCLLPQQKASVMVYLLCQWLKKKDSGHCDLFDSGLIAASAGVKTFAHGLGMTPQIVLPVMVCVSDDADTEYSAGDEVPLYMWQSDEEIGAPGSISFVCVNSTTLTVQTCQFAIGNEANLWVWNKISTLSQGQPTSISNWRLRVRCFACDGVFEDVKIRNPLGVQADLHGLGGVPQVELAVLRCVTNDAGSNMQVNDEMPAWMISSEGRAEYAAANSTETLIGVGSPPSLSCWVKGTDYTTGLINSLNFDQYTYSFRA